MDRFGVIDQANDASEALTGYRRRELVGKPLSILLPPEIAAEHAGHMTAYLKRRGDSTVLGRPRRFSIVHAAGERIPILLKAFELEAPDGRPLFGAMMTDISDEDRKRKESEALVNRLATLALTDELTGLCNRRAFLDALDRERAHVARRGHVSTLVTGDVDRFKSVNDRFGHPAGDRALKQLASLLVDTLRREDLIGRIGGEEFGVLLYDHDRPQAEAALTRLIERLHAAPPPIDGMQGPLTMSFGIVQLDAGRTLQETLAAADGALYEAKAAGRDRFVFAEPAAATAAEPISA